MNEWVDKICFDCQFRIEGKCRKDPPQLIKNRELKMISLHEVSAEWDYPEVKGGNPACSSWRLI